MKFKTNNVERLRITNSGNIGIGTNNPQAKLHVTGNVVLDGLLRLPNISIASSIELNLNNSGFAMISGADNSLKKVSQAQLQKIILNLNYGPLPTNPIGECQLVGGTVNGRWIAGPYKLITNCPDVRVGIGITNPRAKLDVIGITSSDAISIGTDPSAMTNDIFRFRIKGFNPSSTAKLLEVSNTFTNLFSINNQGYAILNGRMDINSSDASTKLSITGYANNTRLLELKRNSNVFMAINEQGLMTLKGRIELTGNMEITTASSTPLIIRNNSTKLLQLDNSGLLHARRIKVDTDAWADFVFEADYKLMPLSELKNYVAEQKHLPNIPSEKEILTDGVDLGEMNKLLLQKIRRTDTLSSTTTKRN